MAYTARVFRILIASPSDVSQEREIVSRVIQEWNDLYSNEKKVVLLPLKWETHSAPELGIRPQESVNKEVVDYCDMAIGVFWTRIGTPTGKADSGTIEEIERVGNSGKIVMLYFSQVKIDPENIDIAQLQKLRDFKHNTYPNGLVEHYSDIVEFRDKLAKQLEIRLRSLIGKDISESTDNNNLVPLTPKLTIGFYDSVNNAYLTSNIESKTRYLSLLNAEEVPDYPIMQDQQTRNENSRIFYLTHSSQKSKDFYRDYLDFVKSDWLLVPMQLFMFNESQIGIRDIFIEIRIKKNQDFVLTGKKVQKPGEDDYNLFTLAGIYKQGDSKIDIVDKSDHYLITLTVDKAIQPQRKLVLDQVFFAGSLQTMKVDFNILTYADCFPQPVEEILSIEFNVHKIEIKAVDFLKDLNIYPAIFPKSEISN